MGLLKTRSLERLVKGFSNHRRIQIMELLEQVPELSVGEIAGRVKTDLKNASQHINRMAISGLVLKRNQKNNIRHKLSPKGIKVLNFLKDLSE